MDLHILKARQSGHTAFEEVVGKGGGWGGGWFLDFCGTAGGQDVGMGGAGLFLVL